MMPTLSLVPWFPWTGCMYGMMGGWNRGEFKELSVTIGKMELMETELRSNRTEAKVHDPPRFW
jgi:hypothetical protein